MSSFAGDPEVRRYAATLQDCEELLNRLEKKPYVDFEVFSQEWRNMAFSLIFCGHKSVQELSDFTDDLLLAAKSLWLPPHSTSRRLLAAYLVYGVYFQQPDKTLPNKFCVTKKEAMEMCEYHKFVTDKNNELPEHCYMHCKLIEADAFRFTAMPYEVNWKGLASPDFAVLASESALSSAVNRVTQGIIASVATVEKKYEQAKAQLMNCAPELAKSVFGGLPSESLSNKLRDLCLKRALDKDNEPSTSAAMLQTTPTAAPLLPCSSSDPGRVLDKDDVPATSSVALNQVLPSSSKSANKDHDRESEWSTEEDEPSADLYRTNKRQHGKSFKQRKKMRPLQGEDNYNVHSKCSRMLHNDPMHNLKARVHPYRSARVRPYRLARDRVKPSLEYLSQGVEFARAAIFKHNEYKLQKDAGTRETDGYKNVHISHLYVKVWKKEEEAAQIKNFPEEKKRNAEIELLMNGHGTDNSSCNITEDGENLIP